jgi:hypothetical protein
LGYLEKQGVSPTVSIFNCLLLRTFNVVESGLKVRSNICRLFCVFRTTEGQNLSLNILDAILLTEKTIQRELELLHELNAYPSAELAIIRKDIKTFKDQQELVLTRAADMHNSGGGGDDEGGNGAGAGGGGESMPTNGYDDLVAILSAENKLCERKLLMLASRRQEEEERRALYMKKIMRSKALEENQARDPANFRNQRF